MTTPDETYPECSRLLAVSDTSQEIGQFLEWLWHESGVRFVADQTFTERCMREGCDPADSAAWCSSCENTGKVNFTAEVPFTPNINALLADYFDIDLDKVEDERRAMLEDIRNAQEQERVS